MLICRLKQEFGSSQIPNNISHHLVSSTTQSEFCSPCQTTDTYKTKWAPL